MPPNYPPGTNSLPPGGTLIIDQTPIVGGTDGYVLYDNNGVVGVEAGGGGSSLTLTDGTNTVADVAQITVTGALVGGTTPNAVLEIDLLPVATGNVTYYVSTTGSDNNPGTIGSPFASVEHAGVVASSFNWGISYSPTIVVEDGAYSALVGGTINLPILVPVGIVVGKLNGNLTTPGNVVFTAEFGFQTSGFGSTWEISGVTVDAVFQAFISINEGSMFLGTNGPCQFQDSSSGGNANVIESSNQGTVAILSGKTFNILSTFNAFLVATGSETTSDGNVVILSPITSLNGSSWLQAVSFGEVNDRSTYTGTATGFPAYYDTTFSAIEQNATGFPGTIAGSVIDATSSVNGVLGGDIDHTIATPLTGGTVTIPPGQNGQVIKPAGTLATLTVQLPPIVNPNSIQSVWISSTQIITALTVSTVDSSSVVGAPSSLAAGQGFSMSYNLADTTWYLEVGGAGSSSATGANPTATAGPTAVPGSATTFMRSDGAPPVQLGSSSQKGIVQVDGTTIVASAGTISVANALITFWGVF